MERAKADMVVECVSDMLDPIMPCYREKDPVKQVLSVYLFLFQPSARMHTRSLLLNVSVKFEVPVNIDARVIPISIFFVMFKRNLAGCSIS